MSAAHDCRHLRRAARLALRGLGRVEPNPIVSCIIVDDNDQTVGWGYHGQFGGPHAEIEALNRAGDSARGATCYVTLEPCAHEGKTPPCTNALINAGITRVVVGRLDTSGPARGGAAMLRDAGIDVTVIDDMPEVTRLTDPFFHRLETNRPYVIAKWAQTIDGRIATRIGESQWISCDRSRRMVHRFRGRVDVILTGIGTVLHDDPMLNARCRTVRRVARRAVIDANLETPIDSRLMQTARQLPLTIYCTDAALTARARHAELLRRAGAEVVSCDAPGQPARSASAGEVHLPGALEHLARQHEATSVLIEAGAGLLGRLFDQNLVNEAWVFIAPLLLGDEHALPALRGRTVEQLSSAIALELIDSRRRDADVMLRQIVHKTTD